MKRVLIYSPGFSYGGIETFIYNLVNSLKNDKDIEISVLTRNSFNDSAIYSQLHKSGAIKSLNVEHLNFSSARIFKRKLNEFLKEGKYDVLHFNAWNEPIVINQARRNGIKKVILHFHSTEMTEQKEIIWRRALKGLVRKSNAKNSDIIITPSQIVRENVKHYIKAKKDYIIPNAIDTDKYKYDSRIREELRSQYGINDNTKVIGHVGRFVDVKNQSFIVDLFHEYKRSNPRIDTKLVFVGDGPTQGDVRRLVKELKIENDVIFTNNRDDVFNILNMMDIFILPSKFEGLPISLIEAQCSGLPCLISSVISQGVIIKDLVHMCDLNSGIDKWVDTLQMIEKNTGRQKYAELVDKNGYGISSLGKMMKIIYSGD